MNKKTLIILIAVGLLAFGTGWLVCSIKPFAEGVIADEKRADSLHNSGQQSVPVSQEWLDSLMIKNNINNKSEDFSEKITGRFVMKGANCAGFNFINRTTVLWTNEMLPVIPDTLKICWLDNSTFITKSTERLNKECPPLVFVYQVISFDGQHLVVNDIWTGWGNYHDDRTEFIKQTSNK